MPLGVIALAVLAWHKKQPVAAPARVQALDLKMSKLYDDERARTKKISNKKGVAGPPPPPGGSMRSIDVVPKEVAERLSAQRAHDLPIMNEYLARAAAVPPEVSRVDLQLAGLHYNLPRVTLLERATPSELAAMSKLYPTRRSFCPKGKDKKVLARRTAAVLEQIGADQDYMVVDATGCASGVVARNVYSQAALLGKSALLCLNACLGLGRGYAKVGARDIELCASSAVIGWKLVV